MRLPVIIVAVTNSGINLVIVQGAGDAMPSVDDRMLAG